MWWRRKQELKRGEKEARVPVDTDSGPRDEEGTQEIGASGIWSQGTEDASQGSEYLDAGASQPSGSMQRAPGSAPQGQGQDEDEEEEDAGRRAAGQGGRGDDEVSEEDRVAEAVKAGAAEHGAQPDSPGIENPTTPSRGEGLSSPGEDPSRSKGA